MRLRTVPPVSRQGVVAGAAGTVVVHGVLLVAVLVSSRAVTTIQPTVYNVELVAAPARTTVSPAPAATPTPPSPPKVAPKPRPTTCAT